MDTIYPEAALRYARFHDWVLAAGRHASPGRAVVREEDSSDEDELEIQARWFGGEFGRRFTGEDGETIEIVQFGHWNRGAGPDFTEAAVRIDGEPRAGAIELDLDVRDWEGHGHGGNPAFDEVVLHVYTDAPSLKRFYTRDSRHRQVPQLQLPQYAWSQGPPDFLPEAFPGRCVAPLASMTDAEVGSLLLAAAQHRLHRKASRFDAMRAAISPEQALFQAMAEALGYQSNRTAMAVLAQRCPIDFLRTLEPLEREALVFGVAGFLQPESLGDREAGRYLRALRDRWRHLEPDFEPAPHRRIPWSYSGNRPLNHPQRRVGALLALVGQWEEVKPVWEKPGSNVKKDVNNFLKNLRHSFWERHFTLSAPGSEKRLRLVGRDRGHDILGNVVFPGAMGSGADLWPQYAALGSVDSNRKLRRAALRLFGSDRGRAKLFTSCYHQQQGLLQIYHDFCLEDVSECATCPFPEQLIQWRRFSGQEQARDETTLCH